MKAAGLVLVVAVFILAAVDPAGSDSTPTVEPGQLRPPPADDAKSVLAKDAYLHLMTMVQYLKRREVRDFGLELESKVLAEMTRMGVHDADQAMVLANLGAAGSTGFDLGFMPIAHDFYGRNAAPLLKSAVALRNGNPTAVVAKADLEALDAQMAQLQAFEPQVWELIRRVTSLWAKDLALGVQVLAAWEARDRHDFTCGSHTGIRVCTQDVEFFRAWVRISNERPSLRSQEDAVMQTYRTMSVQFLTELGGAAPSPSDATTTPAQPFPDDAVAD